MTPGRVASTRAAIGVLLACWSDDGAVVEPDPGCVAAVVGEVDPAAVVAQLAVIHARVLGMVEVLTGMDPLTIRGTLAEAALTLAAEDGAP